MSVDVQKLPKLARNVTSNPPQSVREFLEAANSVAITELCREVLVFQEMERDLRHSMRSDVESCLHRLDAMRAEEGKA